MNPELNVILWAFMKGLAAAWIVVFIATEFLPAGVGYVFLSILTVLICWVYQLISACYKIKKLEELKPDH